MALSAGRLTGREGFWDGEMSVGMVGRYAVGFVEDARGFGGYSLYGHWTFVMKLCKDTKLLGWETMPKGIQSW